jgi:RNA polymerase subunit RPABC4/transcription elongation factor Spt4
LEEEALLRELEQTLSCHQCGVPVKDGWVYCPNCHSQLQHSCPGCGQLARNDWEICVYCGAPQTGHAGVGQSALPAFQPAYGPMGSAPGDRSIRRAFTVARQRLWRPAGSKQPQRAQSVPPARIDTFADRL